MTLIPSDDGGVDLNGARQFSQSSDFSPGGCHENWQDAARPTDEFSALTTLEYY
ncbi:hypothetical protein [Candidatus Nitrotoga sp. M5]|uniref:hypothetical protein n=1 Tax=Candidatus Nitrotoga sp. M5 TaxID=2890409 RepID=UPI001EF1ED83|nr:hypothetical protein [Candidatus Nitrotoga sp. M5]